MKRFLTKVFNYISQIWLGTDNKLSLRAVLAFIVSIHMLFMISRGVYKWEAGRSLAELTGLMTVEAGFVVTLLGISAVQGISFKKEETKKEISQQDKNNE